MMQIFFWFSIALLAFASFAYLTIPIFSNAQATEVSSKGSIPKMPLIFGAALMLASLALYSNIGNPNLLLPSKDSLLNKQYAAIIQQIEAHLAQNPEDAEGWQVVAPTYLSLNQPEKAFDAFANAIKFGNSNGKNWLGLGKSNLIMNKGVFGPMTKVAFTKAQEKSPDDIEAIYFYAAMLQDDQQLDEAEQAILKFTQTHEFSQQQLTPLTELLANITLNRAKND